MYDDKMMKAKKYLQMALDCLEGDAKEEEGETEDIADSEDNESSSSSGGMAAGRSVLRQRLGKLA
jgi:hypothetical protein